MSNVTGSDNIGGTNQSADNDLVSGAFWYEWIELSGSPSNLTQAGFNIADGTLGAGQEVYNAGTTNDIGRLASDGGDRLGNSTDVYGIRLTTQLTVTSGGTYTFDLDSDDGARLYIDGVEVVQHDGLNGQGTPNSGSIALAPGTYDVTIIYFENAYDSGLTANISGPDYASATSLDAANVAANGGNDTITAVGGNDSIEGGAGDDLIYGDYAPTEPTLSPQNTDNLQDTSGTNASNPYAVELVTLANGNLIMISSERGTSVDGIATYRIDNDPNSATYGQMFGTDPSQGGSGDEGAKIDFIQDSASTSGLAEIADMAAVTLSNGNTYVYTADFGENAIGITQINSDGTLTQQTSLSNGNQVDVKELTIVEVGGQPFLLGLNGDTGDSLVAYQINTDGSLTQTDIEADGSGTAENYLNGSSFSGGAVLESITNTAGETFVIAGGSDGGISLWSLDGSGNLTFENARGDDQAGAGDTDPQGNSLGRDVINPANTGLNNVAAGTFAEFGGETYVFVGGTDDDIVAYRVDNDTSGDGSYDLTLVGQLDNVVTDISSMAYLPDSSGGNGSLVVGGESSGLEFYSLTVAGSGEVTMALVNTIADQSGNGAELQDSEDIDVEGGILVSASDNDDGIAIIATGLDDGTGGNATGGGNDTIRGGDGDDTIISGGGDDLVEGGAGADSLTDVGGNDTLSYESSTSRVQTDLDGNPVGIQDGDAQGDTIEADVFENLIGSNFNDVLSGSQLDNQIWGRDGGDQIFGNAGNDTIRGEGGSDSIYAGEGDDVIVGDEALATTDNLLTNGDFSNNLTGWTINNPTGGTGPANSGASDASFNSNNETVYGDGIEQSFASEVGQTHFASLTLGELGNGNSNHTFQIDILDDLGAVISTQTYVATNGTSQNVDFNFIPTSATSTIRITNTTSTGSISSDGWVDDVVIVREVTPDGGNNDLIYGESGNDTIDGASGSDTIAITDGFGFDLVDGNEDTDNADVDVLDASALSEAIEVIYGADAEDGTLTGRTSSDQVTFTNIENVVYTDQDDIADASAATNGAFINTGAGDDSIIGGAGDDTLAGGAGDDIFTVSGGNDTISDFNTGNSGTLDDGDSTNNDFIDLSGYYDNIFELQADQADDGVLNQSNALSSHGNAVDYSDNTQFGSGSLTLSGVPGSGAGLTFENTAVICFGRGTLIMTDQGEVPIEALKEGDLVQTVDNGFKPILWIGARKVDGTGKNAPIRFEPGVLGNHAPLEVSPQHRVLISSKIAERVSGDREILVAAKHLLEHPGVSQTPVDEVEYFHFLFDQHELVVSSGAVTESLYTGAEALKAVAPEARVEILDLFPELVRADHITQPIRKLIKGKQGRSITARHVKNNKSFAQERIAPAHYNDFLDMHARCA